MSDGSSAQWDPSLDFLQAGGQWRIWDGIFLPAPLKILKGSARSFVSAISQKLDVRVSIRNVKPNQIDFAEAQT